MPVRGVGWPFREKLLAVINQTAASRFDSIADKFRKGVVGESVAKVGLPVTEALTYHRLKMPDGVSESAWWHSGVVVSDDIMEAKHIRSTDMAVVVLPDRCCSRRDAVENIDIGPTMVSAAKP